MGALGSSYVTLAEMRSYMKKKPTDPTTGDDDITAALASASRQVDDFCGRQFNKTDLATPRRFRLERSSVVLDVDDFWTDELLAVNGQAYDPLGYSNFELEPFNGVVDGSPGWPYSRIVFDRWSANPYGNTVFEITARWGWAQVPDPIKQATKMVAYQNIKMSDAPLGIQGMEGQFGGFAKVRDIPMVSSMLTRYVLEPYQVG